ncbi:hypothetical protein BROOK1789C_1499 [Bathymodiolus brooksi thiotrophic gill symbiont]|nr:hypothetical protein BROOK1789C_1499 [Bathymodiolus brooksi thiotrophic gill symbiont]CAC9542671.1 hypothetical protein [uncultured Gammaproteobacteria bacterium]CAC9583160.1 hypothetical protein [uncultured Gammaproteobacteria bacterium]CAC9613349.1 hypothetical protein [uncultured Gammaproteobacteria bacterium]CAC9628356.1 hypothetical protein [uncultured Gammaproteobacteria bacterium]
MQVSFNDLLVGFFCSGCEALSYGFLSFLHKVSSLPHYA